MKQSVSAIFICGEKALFMKRQNYLRAFPGYTSFPGGKVDEEDLVQGGDDYLLYALKREIAEELSIHLDELQRDGIVTDITQYSLAVTPDFNPHRFENYYYKIFIKDEQSLANIEFKFDEGEIADVQWLSSHEAFESYQKGDMLVVPPMITILEDLDRDITSTQFLDSNLKYDTVKEVPMIEPLHGLRQFMPLSNTFPPANRTNCFLLGDEGEHKVLVDPSPKNEEELEKLLYSIRNHKINEIFLTHHHPDHHEFSRDIARKLNIPFAMSEGTLRHLLLDYDVDYLNGFEIKHYEDGDILTKSCGVDVKVVTTGGHAFGQSSLLRVDGAWMIVSDLIQTIGTVTIGGQGSCMREYFQSLQNVINIAPRVSMPSHGICLGGTRKIEETLKHRLEREEQILECLKDGMDREEIYNTVYPNLPERLRIYALATIDSHLDKLRDYGPGIC